MNKTLAIMGAAAIVALTGLTAKAAEISIIPKPVETKQIDGAEFELTSATKIAYSSDDSKQTAELLAKYLCFSTANLKSYQFKKKWSQYKQLIY